MGFSSCENTADNLTAIGDTSVNSVSLPAPAATLAAAPAAEVPEVVLVRGNYWVNGISGFGINGFSALTGEYRIRGFPAQPAEGGVFTVFVTREPLFFSGEWQNRPVPTGTAGTRNISVLQRSGEEGFFAATEVADGRGTTWIAVLWFRTGLEGAGISGDVFNRIFRVWTSRLSYFLSLARMPGEISLPAVLEF